MLIESEQVIGVVIKSFIILWCIVFLKIRYFDHDTMRGNIMLLGSLSIMGRPKFFFLVAIEREF